MGNAQIKPLPRVRNKKQVHWRAADRPPPPGKPELLPESEGTPDLVTLRWSRPVNDGGSPISGYLVEHRRVGSPHWVRATPLPVPFPEITLSGLEPGWRYQFRVSAENAVGYSDPSEISEQITVTFQRSAVTAPKFTENVKDTVALENNKCEFVVHFLGQPAPKVCWFKDGFEIFSSRRIRILTEYDRSVLTIHQTSLSDEGEIKCTATNKAGHISSKARLTVEAPPSIRLPRNYEEGLLFEIGEIIRLKVSVVGRPTPLVLWTHNGESIQDNDRYETEYTDKSYSLKIAEAQRGDRGEYHIKAVNKLGEDNTSFLVTVTDKPSPPVTSVPGKARVVMTLGRSVTLSWTSPEDDGGCKIGNYIVEYYRLGWNVWLKAATSRQLTTRLGDLIEGSEYKFRVKAESPYGVSDPSEESEIIFIPDLKRGLTHPSPRGRTQQKDFFEETTKPMVARNQNKPRSQSSSRVELPSKVSDFNDSITAAGIPPVRPKRTKSRSQQHTPETTPQLQRKVTDSQINKNIFDRASLSRDLAYGSPDFKIRKELEPPLQKRRSISSNSDGYSDLSNTPSPEPKASTAYKVKIEKPKDEPNLVITESKKDSSPEGRSKLIREHSETVSGSSEFMLILYSDENKQDHSDMFNFDENSIPPPLSLSAPELSCLEQPLFPPLKNSASSTELLHEKAMMRFYQAAEAEEKELEEIRSAKLQKNLSLDIPKIQINSKDRENIVNSERRHSLRRKMSAGSLTQQQAKWAQKRHSLKNPSELKGEILLDNLKKSPVSVDMNRDLIQNSFTSKDYEEKGFHNINSKKKLYTQASFVRKPVTIVEEQKWNEEYEESMSESETESEPDYEKFKNEVSKSKKVHLNRSFDQEEDTYRPAGGLGSMKSNSNEPFEILNKRKTLPDPNFIPKPILKKIESPFTSPNISPAVSPPSSPTKVARALSPRPDIILQRNRSKSLAVPALPPLISASSGDESDEPKIARNRSLSLIVTNSSLPQQKFLPNLSKKSSSRTFSNIAAVAHITGITAASIVIPDKLLDSKRDAEAARVVADHYDDIVKSIGQRRKSNPQVYLDREALKKVAEGSETPHEFNLSSKEQTPSKENLSQDSGYQSVSSYRRSSFTDHYDSLPPCRSKIRTPPVELTQNPFERGTQATSPIRSPPAELKKNPFEQDTQAVSPIRSPPAEFKSNPFEQGMQAEFQHNLRKNSLTEQRVDSLVKSNETNNNNLLNRKGSHFSQQIQDISPIRRISNANQTSTRRDSGTAIQLSNNGISNNNLQNRRGSNFSQQTQDKSPIRRISNANQTSTRRDSGTGIQLGNFAPQASFLVSQTHQGRKTSTTPKSSRSVGRSKSPSKRGTSTTRRSIGMSPSRPEDFSKLKSPNDTGKTKETSPSPSPLALRRPMLKEIMTQTSGYLDSFSLESFTFSRTSTPGFNKSRQEELLARAEVQVRSAVDWLTDLAMFAVACWLYLFSNELLAIPVLLVMVYRQLKEEIRKRIPGWTKKIFKRKP